MNVEILTIEKLKEHNVESGGPLHPVFSSPVGVVSDRCLKTACRSNKNPKNLLMSSLSSKCAELEDFILGGLLAMRSTGNTDGLKD